MERRRAVRRPAQRPSNASPSWTNQTVPQLVTGEPLVWALVQPTRRRSCGVAERRNACRIVSRPRLYRKPYTAAARRAPGQTSRSPFRYVRDSRTSIGLHRDESFSVHPCHPKTEHLANVPHRGSNTNCGASSDHDVNNNIHKTQPRRSTLVRAWLSSCRPRGSCGSMIRVRIVPARRLHHAITSFRLATPLALP